MIPMQGENSLHTDKKAGGKRYEKESDGNGIHPGPERLHAWA
jgi:hypothetical protein